MDQNHKAPAPEAEKVSGGAINDKTLAIVAYIIFFIPLLVSQKRSAFLNYHINQGLSLFIVAVVGLVVLSFLGWRLYFLLSIWKLLSIVWMVIGIINASKNEMKPLPVIGNWFKLIK